MRILIAGLAIVACGAGVAHAEGDIAKGEQVFKKCFACHTVGPDAKVKVGPVLNDIFGKPSGAQAEYASKYSRDMIEAGEGGYVWTEEPTFSK